MKNQFLILSTLVISFQKSHDDHHGVMVGLDLANLVSINLTLLFVTSMSPVMTTYSDSISITADFRRTIKT